MGSLVGLAAKFALRAILGQTLKRRNAMGDQPTGRPKVSVVVPVHNGERFLGECLDSLVEQTLAGLEIVIVDDASTDRSPSILARYKEEHPNLFRIVRLDPNRGVSVARNTGIDQARGEFLAFVDADDIVDPTMYERLLNVVEPSVDVVSCGLRLINVDGDPLDSVPYPMSAGTVVSGASMQALLTTAFTSKLLWSPWRSIYRRSLIMEEHIRFDSGIRKGEDSLFNLEVLSRADGCRAVDDVLYSYRKHGNSVTARPLPSERGNLDTLSERVRDVVKAQGLPPSVLEDFYRYILTSDLPMALVRLAGNAESRAQISALRASPNVEAALGTVPLSTLHAPLQVRLLLALLKRAPVRLVDLLVGFQRRLSQR